MVMLKAHIDKWRIISLGHCEVLEGMVSGHPNQANFGSRRVTTSRLLHIEVEAGTAETQNTMYTLGERL